MVISGAKSSSSRRERERDIPIAPGPVGAPANVVAVDIVERGALAAGTGRFTPQVSKEGVRLGDDGLVLTALRLAAFLERRSGRGERDGGKKERWKECCGLHIERSVLNGGNVYTTCGTVSEWGKEEEKERR